MSYFENTAGWQKLLTLAQEIQKQAPWKYLYEDTFIGVESSLSGQLNFINTTGSLKEHLSVSLYLGLPGLLDFFAFRELALNIDNPLEWAFLLYDIPLIQLSFCNREELEKEDLAIIKKSGLKFRGANNWPMVRVHEESYYPWFLEDDDVDFFVEALEQFLELFKEQGSKLNTLTDPAKEEFMVCLPKMNKGELTWHKEVRHISLGEDLENEKFEIRPLPDHIIKTIKPLPVLYKAVEVLMTRMPMPVLDEATSPRPFFPTLFIVVDKETGQVVYHDILAPNPSFRYLVDGFAEYIAQFFFTVQGRSKEVHLLNDNTTAGIIPIMKKLGVTAKIKQELTNVEEAVNSFWNYMNFPPNGTR